MKEFGSSVFRDVIIIHGPPGVGKGTLSDRFEEQHDYVNHISAGDTVRAILSGAVTSRNLDVIRATSSQGLLMPGDVSTDVMYEAMATDTNSSLFLIDGYPQLKSELDTLMLRADEQKVRIVGALCLEADAATAIARMERRGLRDGERTSGVNNTLDYYRQRYDRFMVTYATIKAELANSMDLIEIDASGEQAAVYQQFTDIIIRAAPPQTL